MRIFNIIILGIHTVWLSTALVQEVAVDSSLDRSIENFLDKQGNSWRDMNIPAGDGQVLYELIIKNNYTQALEIGTSTGHSAIWIAWALSKTGGKLITIEISESRYKQALVNFKEAGVGSFIDARLANAHDLVPQLEGPFDFIFLDADKEWYSQYLKWLLPKMETGGCFAAHNVSNAYMDGIPEFLEYLDKTKELETTIINSSPSGISVSYVKEH